VSERPDEPAVRASDAEREATADALRRAGAEGRLDPEELEERLAQAYAARTRADLGPLTRDLPPAASPAAAPAVAPASPPPDRWTKAELRERAAGFLVPNLISIGVWLASGAQGSFWPIWVLLVTGVILVASFVRGPEADRRHRAERAARRRR
jgi:hypothetical protein